MVIAFANLAIITWETAQPLIVAWCVYQMAARAPYLIIATAIVYPMITIQFPYGVLLPFFREVYTVRYFRPQLQKHLSRLCLEGNKRLEDLFLPGESRDKGPTVQMARDVLTPLVDSLLRDPLFIARGIILFLWLLWMSPSLGSLLAAGMMLDIWITLLMEARLNPLYRQLRTAELRVKGIENELFDLRRQSDVYLEISLPVWASEWDYHRTRECAEARERARLETLWNSSWDEYIEVTAKVETRRLIFQSPLREGASWAMRLGMMLLVGWWVHTGDATLPEYLVLTSLVSRANDPMYVIFNWQQQLMQYREVLRRLEILTGKRFLGPRVTK
jgi:ABC-type multidrug transport system fused ATPase/permease subunit